MKIQASTAIATLPLARAFDQTLSAPDDRLGGYLRSAAEDSHAVKQAAAPDGLGALPEDVIPWGESHFSSSLTADLLGLGSEWPWTITRTAQEIKMFCPGRVNPETGKHEDKQIILSSDPSQPGKAILKIMMDGDWMAPVFGRLVTQAGGAVFQGDGGETVSLKANRKGFRIDLDGFERICPDLDGCGIQMDRVS